MSAIDERLRQSVLKLAVAGLVLAAVLVAVPRAGCAICSRTGTACAIVATLGVLAVIGGVVYGGIVLALFGRGWLAAFRGRSHALKPSISFTAIAESPRWT